MEKELIEQTIKYLQKAAATLSLPCVGVSPQTDTVNGVAAASEFRRTFSGMHGIRPGLVLIFMLYCSLLQDEYYVQAFKKMSTASQMSFIPGYRNVECDILANFGALQICRCLISNSCIFVTIKRPCLLL